MLCLKRLKSNFNSDLEYSIYIDDVCEGYIDDGKYIKIKVAEGEHNVKVLRNHAFSNTMCIDF